MEPVSPNAPATPLKANIIQSGVAIEGILEKKKSKWACLPSSRATNLTNIYPGSRNICLPEAPVGSIGSAQKATLVPFEKIIWATRLENVSAPGHPPPDVVQIVYARNKSASKLELATVNIQLAKNNYLASEDDDLLSGSTANLTLDDLDPVHRIMDEAYRGIKAEKRLLVLINPHGGQGKAKSIYKRYGAPFFAAAHCKTTVMSTTHRYHAAKIAEELAIDLYDAIVCCSGDGIPHEVINGLAKRSDAQRALSKLAICQFPCGSGNSMAMSLNGNASPSLAALSIIKGFSMKIDLMCMTQGDKRAFSFLSQTYGLVADADLGTESLRWMGGTRFALGAVIRALAQTTYPCDLYIKYAHETKKEVSEHFNRSIQNEIGNSAITSRSRSSTNQSKRQYQPEEQFESGSLFARPLKYGTVNDAVPTDWQTQSKDKLGFFYVGKMPWMSSDALVFPASLPNDGTLDLAMWDSSIGRFTAVDLLTKIEKGRHIQSEDVDYAKIEAYRLVPKIKTGFLSIDGESFPLEPFQVEVVHNGANLLSSTGAYSNNDINL